MNDKELYILKPNVVKLFVQLDVNKLKQQLEEILLDHNIAIAESDFADGRLHKKISKKAVNSVLALIGLEENKGNKHDK